MRHPEVADRLAPLIEAGLVATTAQLDAELHYDSVFEIAAEVLPLRHQWVLERGSID